MHYNRLKSKVVTGLFIASVFFVACNSNQSSDKIADTATARMTDNAPDTVKTTIHDTVTVVQPSVPTTTVQPSAPATTAQSSATPPVEAAPTPTPAPSKTIIKKKKVQVFVESAPVVKHPRIMADKNGVYQYSQVSPSYLGGQSAIEKYINNHINYPENALDDNREGRVGVSFIVSETGQVTNAHIEGTKLGDGLDQEAIRVVSSMPHWKPGTVKGRPVKTRVTLPITFKIAG